MSSKVQAWFDALPEEWQERAQHLRELVLDAAPNMKEEWKYELPFYSNGRWMCYLSVQKGQLILAFIEGIHLTDAEGLFAMTAHKQIRQFKPMPPPARINEQALRQLIAEAAAYNTELIARRTGKR